MLIEFLRFIKRLTEDFHATDIFYDTNYTFSIHEPRVEGDLFGIITTSVSSHEHVTYTKIGQWFEDMPAIFSLLKLPYYLIAYPYEFIGMVVWGIIELFLPKRIKEYLR